MEEMVRMEGMDLQELMVKWQLDSLLIKEIRISWSNPRLMDGKRNKELRLLPML